jgi:hypothetical protein
VAPHCKIFAITNGLLLTWGHGIDCACVKTMEAARSGKVQKSREVFISEILTNRKKLR